MPKKRRNGLFDFLKPRTTVYHVRSRRKVKPSLLSSKIRALGSHKIVKVGDHYEVPSLDRGSWFDTREDAQRFIREMKKYNPKRKSRTGRRVAKARKSGDSAKADYYIQGQTKRWYDRKKRRTGGPGSKLPNPTIGLPSNQFVNAKVRLKGGKVQILADQSVLGKAGFKADAGLKGVSVSGGAKLNPNVSYEIYNYKTGDTAGREFDNKRDAMDWIRRRKAETSLRLFWKVRKVKKNPRALGKRLTGYPVKRKLKRSIESHPGITKREETYLHRQAERLRKRFVGPRGRLPNPRVTLSGRNDSTDRSVYSGDERIGTVQKSSKTGEWQAKDRSGRNHGWYTSDWNAAKQLALALGK